MTDILDDVEVVADEFAREADLLMNYCDRCGTNVLAKTHIIIGDGELKYCWHHTTRYRAGLNDQGAFIYNIA